MLLVNLARLLGPGRMRPALGARSLTIHDPDSGCGIATNSGKGNRLLTETGLYGHPLASLGAPARDDRLAALGLHPGTKSVRLRAVTPVRLECALGHETYLLLIQLVGAIMAIGRMRSINDPRQTGKPALVRRAERSVDAPAKVHCRTSQFCRLLHHARGSYKVAT